jgi:UDP-glucose 4-epimerase
MLTDVSHAHDLRSIALRYFNATGADPDGEIGEAHDPEPHLTPRVLAATHDGTSVAVYGNDCETADGTCTRDYIHVNDMPMHISSRLSTSSPVALAARSTRPMRTVSQSWMCSMLRSACREKPFDLR